MSQSVHHYATAARSTDRQPTPGGSATHCAQLILGVNGEIKHLTKDARSVLGYYPSQRIQKNFFQLVHEDHRVRVMWEFAEMVGRRRQRAEWTIRLKTGPGTGPWWRVRAANQLHQSGPSGILVTLTPASQARGTQPIA